MVIIHRLLIIHIKRLKYVKSVQTDLVKNAMTQARFVFWSIALHCAKHVIILIFHSVLLALKNLIWHRMELNVRANRDFTRMIYCNQKYRVAHKRITYLCHREFASTACLAIIVVVRAKVHKRNSVKHVLRVNPIIE